MNKTEIRERLKVLMNVYRYTLINGGLSASQRICITQERVALMHCQDRLNEEPFALVTPRYNLPEKLNEKVLFINIRAKKQIH